MRVRLAVGLAALLLLAVPTAMASHHFDRDTDARHDVLVRQRASLDEDAVLAALALGGRGSDICDFDNGVFPGRLDFTARERVRVDRDVDLDEDDVLAHLILGRGHHRHHLLGDHDSRSLASARVHSDVDFDEDDVLLALALGCDDFVPADVTFRSRVRVHEDHDRGFGRHGLLDDDMSDALLLRALL